MIYHSPVAESLTEKKEQKPIKRKNKGYGVGDDLQDLPPPGKCPYAPPP